MGIDALSPERIGLIQPRVGPPFLGPTAVLPWVTTPQLASTLKGLDQTSAPPQAHSSKLVWWRRSNGDGPQEPKDATLSGLRMIPTLPQGRTVQGTGTGRFNPGLNDAIPSGLAERGRAAERGRWVESGRLAEGGRRGFRENGRFFACTGQSVQLLNGVGPGHMHIPECLILLLLGGGH